MGESTLANGGLGGQRSFLGGSVAHGFGAVKVPQLADVAARVRGEIDTFVPPQPHPEQLGALLPPEWFMAGLEVTRAALVEPYFLIVDGDGRYPDKEVALRVVIVAEDDEILLAFDPDSEGDFALIFRSAARFGLSPIRGGAVDCFLSR